jgi:hypothetical protein
MEVLELKDAFNRGLACHGIVDLLIAGGEAERAKVVLDSVDQGVRESIIATDPATYSALV